MILFDFSKKVDITNWRVIDDVVMGGKSNGNFYINEEENAVFTGEISLDNNGGFSSVRYNFDTVDIGKYTKIVLLIKGDGKKYQFRVKTSKNDYFSYITEFKTTKEWKKIEINLSSLYPAFRGRKLRMENYPSEKMEEIAFLIGNKKAENFRLEIDKITFE